MLRALTASRVAWATGWQLGSRPGCWRNPARRRGAYTHL